MKTKYNISKCMEFVCKTFHPNAEEYTFLSSAYETFSRINHMLGHKTSFSKFLKTDIILCIYSDPNAMKLEIKYKKKLQTIQKSGGYTT